MKRHLHILLLPTILLLAASACTRLHVVRTAQDGSRVEFTGTSLFSNTVLKGVGVDSTTKTTTNLLKLTSSTTEPNAESITASGDALGNMIGTAVKTAGGMPK